MPFAVAAAALAATPAALPAGGAWKAHLTAGDVVPKQRVQVPKASGSFTGTLRGFELTFKLTFSKLSGPAVEAHIGYGRKGKPGNITVPLCAPCVGTVSTTAFLNPSVTKAFRQGLLFVAVSTAKNPNGEIRGQLAAAGA
jgi:hypothetical protein